MTYQHINVFSFTREAKLPHAPEPFLVEGILHRSQTIIYGQTMAGKSMLGLSLAAAVVSGRPWNGYAVSNSGPVAIVSGDPDGQHENLERLARIRDDIAFGEIRVITPERPTTRDAWVEIADVTSGCSLMILDNLTQFVPGSLNDDSSVRQVYEQLQMLSRGGMAICTLAHTSDKKNEHGWSSELPMGSTIIRTVPRWFVYLKRSRGLLTVNLSGNSGRPWQLLLSEPTDTPRFEVLDSQSAEELAERTEQGNRQRSRERLDRNAQIYALREQGHTQEVVAEMLSIGVDVVKKAEAARRRAEHKLAA